MFYEREVKKQGDFSCCKMSPRENHSCLASDVEKYLSCNGFWHKQSDSETRCPVCQKQVRTLQNNI